MTHDTILVTAMQFEQLLQTALKPIKDQMGTFATKDDLQRFATKEDLKGLATKEDLKGFAAKDDLKGLATKDDVQQSIEIGLQPIKEDIDFLKEYMATKEDVRVLKQDMHTRFEWLHEGVDQALIVLGNVEKKLEGKIVNHEHRIKRLEKKAGLAQIGA